MPGDTASGAIPGSAPSPAKRVADLLLIAILLYVPAHMSLNSNLLGDFDIWWHIQTGAWISAHHAVPHVEPFSGPMAGTPWVAYSWFFELVTYKLFHWFGLKGVLIYTSGLLLLITAALFGMIRRHAKQLPAAALLTFACMFSMGHLFTPRPWLFSILFFTLELDILLDVRRTGRTIRLLWLPLMFAAWANIHIQFVNGLFILGLAAAESIAARRWKGVPTRAAILPLLAVLVASIFATLANPYGWRIYAVAHELATQSGALNKISELQAIPFRDFVNYLALLLVLGSAATLGWLRRIVSFEGALLAFAAVVSFRSQRDEWLLAVVAAAILAELLPKVDDPTVATPKYVPIAAGTLAAIALTVALQSPRLSNAHLRDRVAESQPVNAVDFIRQHGYRGPLFNDFNWGGYLILNLRMPVSLDGRQNVYGDERIDRNVATWAAGPEWRQAPELASANLIIGPAASPLTQILRRDQRYDLVYQDKVAAVFVPRK